MDIQRKHELLAQAKSNRVSNIPIVESETEPNTTHCIWLKQGIMYAFENGVWEAITGEGGSGGGEDPYLIAPKYPLEFPYFNTTDQATLYAIFDDASNPPFTYIPDMTVYVIAKIDDNTYTLIDQLSGDKKRSLSGTLYPEPKKSMTFRANCVNTATEVGIRYPETVDPDDPDKTDIFTAFVAGDPNNVYQAMILDTEYNTDKYPHGGGGEQHAE